VNGDCNDLNGTCNCMNNFVGIICDIRCLDLDCNTNCTCNNSNTCSNNETLCTDETIYLSNKNITISNNNTTILNNLNVNDTSLFIFGSITILGNASFENSLLSFNTSETIINGDLSFTSSSFIFSNSTIVVQGCVYLKNNTQFTIDFSKYKIGNENTNIVLITSLNSCLNKEGDISFKYLNQPITKCLSITNNIDSNSLSIIFKLNTCDSSIGDRFQSPFNIIKILIFIYAVIVII